MKLFGTKSTPNLEEELRKLEDRRRLLEDRCAALRATAQVARQAALDNLVAGDIDDAATQERLETEARAAQHPVNSLAHALGEIDTLIDETKARIAAEKTAAERKRRAEEIERDAKLREAQAAAIGARIKALDSAAATLAGEFEKLVSALPDDFAMPMMRRNPNNLADQNHAAAPNLARAIVASALASRAPAIFEPIEPLAELAAPAYERRALLLQHIDERQGLLQYMLIESADPTALPTRIEAAIVDNLHAQAAALRGESQKLAEAA